MKKLLITLLLISPLSFADWGDVYYCNMTSYSALGINGVRRDKTLEKFQFKLDKEKQAMVFGSGGEFAGVTIKVTDETKTTREAWHSREPLQRAQFVGGMFLYSLFIPIEVTTMTANCDKF